MKINTNKLTKVHRLKNTPASCPRCTHRWLSKPSNNFTIHSSLQPPLGGVCLNCWWAVPPLSANNTSPFMRRPYLIRLDHISKRKQNKISYNTRKKILSLFFFILSCCILAAFHLSVWAKLTVLAPILLFLSVGRISSPTFPFGNGSWSHYLRTMRGGRPCRRREIQRDMERCGGTNGILFLLAFVKKKQNKTH